MLNFIILLYLCLLHLSCFVHSVSFDILTTFLYTSFVPHKSINNSLCSSTTPSAHDPPTPTDHGLLYSVLIPYSVLLSILHLDLVLLILNHSHLHRHPNDWFIHDPVLPPYVYHPAILDQTIFLLLIPLSFHSVITPCSSTLTPATNPDPHPSLIIPTPIPPTVPNTSPPLPTHPLLFPILFLSLLLTHPLLFPPFSLLPLIYPVLLLLVRMITHQRQVLPINHSNSPTNVRS